MGMRVVKMKKDAIFIGNCFDSILTNAPIWRFKAIQRDGFITAYFESDPETPGTFVLRQ
jgi:hypothetical protein